MIADQSDVTTRFAQGAAVREVSPCYAAAPALPEVLQEQMFYLLEHAGHNAAGCSDCLRLAQVVRLLMRAFE